MRIPALSATLALVAFYGNLHGQEAPNLETALLPLPEELRAEATILILTDTREFEVLRAGSNGFFCIADQPGDDRFSVNCHPESLRTFLERRRSYPADSRAERDSVLTAEILAGLLAVPNGALSWYMQANINEETGVPDEVTVWNELTAPFATTDATGMGTVDAGAVPWLMSAGRYSAHIMVGRRTVVWSELVGSDY